MSLFFLQSSNRTPLPQVAVSQSRNSSVTGRLHYARSRRRKAKAKKDENEGKKKMEEKLIPSSWYVRSFIPQPGHLILHPTVFLRSK